MLKTLLKEPLLHFIGIALLFFIAYQQMNPTGADDLSITVSEGRQQLLKNQFTQRWKREPLPAELQNSVLLYALNEMYAREARSLGMDQGDVVIDRRLKQKMDFMLEDIATAMQPSEQEIQAFYQANTGRYHRPERYTFTQIYLSTDRPESEVERLIAENSTRLAEGYIPQGDATLLPRIVRQQSGAQVQARFGKQFAATLNGLAVDQWHGPVASSIGLHYVLLTEKIPATAHALESVRQKVIEDLQHENRQLLVKTFEEKLQNKYSIIIEQAQPAEAVQ